MNPFKKQKASTARNFTTKFAQPLTQAVFAIIGTNISAWSVDKESIPKSGNRNAKSKQQRLNCILSTDVKQTGSSANGN